MISDFVPVTVIFSPLRTAAPSSPPRPGARSTTLPFWRYRLRTSPPGPALKARIREVWVTTGSCENAGGAAGVFSGAPAGGIGGAGGGLCANATEPKASPRAVTSLTVAMRAGDGMFIGDTSACTEASGLPFTESAKNRRIHAFLLFESSGIHCGSTAIRSTGVRIADRLDWPPHPRSAPDLSRSRQYRASSGLEAQLHTILAWSS